MELIFALIRRLEITDEEGEVKILQNDKIIKMLEAEEKHEKDLQKLSKEEIMKVKQTEYKQNTNSRSRRK